MILRDAQNTLENLSKDYPAVIITGPRQSGKTTLAVSTFPDMEYCTFENFAQRRYAKEDPEGFLAQFPKGGILDEVQFTPELMSYLQELIDFDSSGKMWILTGSQRFGVLSGVSQSLAGRAAYLELLPFSLNELQRNIADWSLDSVLLTGLYPPVHDRSPVPGIWAQNYIRSYVERDVRQMTNVRDLNTFQRFLGLCAARTGQLLNLSNLASDSGITHNTAKAWISILEASYIILLLRPHHANFRKRLVKTPKLYFHDTGLAAYLLSIETEKNMNLSAMRGPLFENLIVSEMLKGRYNRGRRSNLFFWRDRAGHEVDIILDRGVELTPIEIKSGFTLASDSFTTLNWWLDLSSQERSFLVYGGEVSSKRSSVEVISWRDNGLIQELL